MKQKLTKISDEDFDGLLPSAPSSQPEAPVALVSEADLVAVEAATKVTQSTTVVKASKSNKGKPTTATGISIRLMFSTQDYKSLTLLALTESEKIGKRVSVTSLLMNQANKLIRKGSSNA